MQDILMALVTFGGLSIIFMTVFGFFAYLRYLKHKETIALAEKGLLKPENVVQYNGDAIRDKRLLNRAIILIAIGFALCLGLFPIGFLVDDGFPLLIGPWMLAGFLPLFFGIALLIIYLLPLFPDLLNRLSVPENRETTDEEPSRAVLTENIMVKEDASVQGDILVREDVSVQEDVLQPRQ